MDPDAEVLPPSRVVRIVSANGEPIIGRVLNQDALNILIIDQAQKLRGFNKRRLKEMSFVQKGLMPSYADKLSPRDLDDLVAFILQMRVQGK
jgi:hypothetical protein